MLPIALGLAEWPVLLVGQGPAMRKRHQLLCEAGTAKLLVFETDLPSEDDIAASRVLFVAGLELEMAEPLAALARRHRVLVNVEDVPALCDFHLPALIRRGDLSIAIATNGQSPALAALLRRDLAARFDTSWGPRLATLAAARARLRADGADGAAVMRETERLAAPWLAQMK